MLFRSATTKESFSEGASGAFLFFSKDGEYIVKTTNREEMHVLDSIAADYEEHLNKYPKSRLMRILGAHSMEIYGQKLYFLVMNNIFPAPRHEIKIDERYDLKGSWVNRQSGGYNKPRGIVLKDMDLNFQFKTRPDVGCEIARTIKADAEFLASKNIMDYSLLVGVVHADLDIHVEAERPRGTSTHSVSSMREANFLNPGQAQQAAHSGEGGMGAFYDPYEGDEHGGMQASVVTGPTKFYVGIIDILQTWNVNKRLERYSKIYFKCVDGNGLSAVEPERYRDRFVERTVMDNFVGARDERDSQAASAESNTSEPNTPINNKSLSGSEHRRTSTGSALRRASMGSVRAVMSPTTSSKPPQSYA